MTSAGFQAVAGRIPGERIATSTEVSNSAVFTTTEAETQSVTAPLVEDRTYQIVYDGQFQSSTGGDRVVAKIREDAVTGTQLKFGRVVLDSADRAYPLHMEAEYTATATGDKTFSVTGDRDTGSGDHAMAATATDPSLLYVNYLSG